MISPKGIVHVSPGKQSEHTTLTSWLLAGIENNSLPSFRFEGRQMYFFNVVDWKGALEAHGHLNHAAS